MKKLIFIFLALFIVTAGAAWADPPPVVDGTCTTDPQYNIPTANGNGIISTIVQNIKDVLSGLSATMFSGIASDSNFISGASAALILYIIVYAITFMFGMVQLTVFDFMIRMVKISIVVMLVKGTAYAPFSQTFVHFFNDGTDELITKVSSFAVGGTSGGPPFDWMDNAILELTSAKMMITLMAAAATGPYGWVIIILLVYALKTFIEGMLNAMWVYIMSLVLRTLLFGLAPLFLACIMFSRTRQLFDGWLNQVVNSCLQPIFLFTFFSFFVQLIKSCLDLMMQYKVCWTEWAETLRGTPFTEHYWRFAIKDCNLGIYVPFDGVWGFTGADSGCSGNVVHPIGIMLPLTLWILSDLAKRFNGIVVHIAKDIANASTSFNAPSSSFGGGGGKGGGGGGGGSGGGGGGGGGGNQGGGGGGNQGKSAPNQIAADAVNRQGKVFEDVKKLVEKRGGIK